MQRIPHEKKLIECKLPMEQYQILGSISILYPKNFIFQINIIIVPRKKSRSILIISIIFQTICFWKANFSYKIFCICAYVNGFRKFSQVPPRKVPFGWCLGAGDAKRRLIFGWHFWKVIRMRLLLKAGPGMRVASESRSRNAGLFLNFDRFPVVCIFLRFYRRL